MIIIMISMKAAVVVVVVIFKRFNLHLKILNQKVSKI
jgi:hypothetical protein